MPDADHALISSIVQRAGVIEARAAGIEPKHFVPKRLQDRRDTVEPIEATIYRWMLDFVGDHRESPGIEAFRNSWPRYELSVSQEPLSYHLKRFVSAVTDRRARELVEEAGQRIASHRGAVPDELFVEIAREFAETIPQEQMSRLSDMRERVARYDKRLETGERPGTFFGLPTIDRATYGVQPTDLAVFAGASGAGKSIMLAYVVVSAYLQGRTSLFYSLEMDEDEVWHRIDVMLTKVKYMAMRALELDIGERDEWERMAERVYSDRHKRDVHLYGGVRKPNVDRIMFDTLRLNPGAVFVDYVDIMDAPRDIPVGDWRAVQANIIEMKEMARKLRIPVITASQLNKEGDIAHQSVRKNVDLLLKLRIEEDEFDGVPHLWLDLDKNRKGPPTKCEIKRDVGRMEIREKDEVERFPLRPTVKPKRRVTNGQKVMLQLEQAWMQKDLDNGKELAA
jgi:replicative DNA helicase